MGRRYLTTMLGVLIFFVLVYTFNSMVLGPPMVNNVTTYATTTTAGTTTPSGPTNAPAFLVSFESLTPSRDNLFFIETSCAFLDRPPGGLIISARQACAIYSTARLNTKAKIYLLHSCPLSYEFYEQSSAWAQMIFDVGNVKVVEVKSDPESWFRGSPLEGLAPKLKQSSYRLEHTSDLFRLLILWLFGGTYLDLDFVVIRDLTPLGENWSGAESEDTVSSGAMNFSPEGSGHEFLTQILKELKENFNPWGWSDNGPLLMTRLLRSYCHLSEDENMQEVAYMKVCNFTVYKAKFFYPIYYPSWGELFTETGWTNVEQATHDSFMVHVWNKLSKKTVVTVGSNQPYGMFASRYCLPVYLSANPNF